MGARIAQHGRAAQSLILVRPLKVSETRVSDIVLHVRVSPGAKRSAVIGRYGTGWKISVAAPPEGGRANAELVRLLASALGVPERTISIVSGLTSRNKTVAVEGVDAEEADRRLDSVAQRR